MGSVMRTRVARAVKNLDWFLGEAECGVGRARCDQEPIVVCSTRERN